MSRKDFERAVRIVKRTAEQVANGEDTHSWLAREFADWFAESSAQFDRERFLKACEVTK